jgi:1,2-diacylglycerol 3-alpha-glucosyltransferase
VSLNAGIPRHQQTMLPYGIKAQRGLHPLSQCDQHCLRLNLALPSTRPIVLTVGAVNKTHKRMDYVIRELAQLPKPRPFLMILGQREPETTELEKQATEQLEPGAWMIRTVPPAAIQDYYRAANIFVLASFSEGFGRVFVEALLHGLPVITHRHPVAQFVLNSHGTMADLSIDGTLSALVSAQILQHETPDQKQMRALSAYNRFSWDVLRSAYSEMFQRVCSGEANGN